MFRYLMLLVGVPLGVLYIAASIANQWHAPNFEPTFAHKGLHIRMPSAYARLPSVDYLLGTIWINTEWEKLVLQRKSIFESIREYGGTQTMLIGFTRDSLLPYRNQIYGDINLHFGETGGTNEFTAYRSPYILYGETTKKIRVEKDTLWFINAFFTPSLLQYRQYADRFHRMPYYCSNIGDVFQMPKHILTNTFSGYYSEAGRTDSVLIDPELTIHNLGENKRIKNVVPYNPVMMIRDIVQIQTAQDYTLEYIYQFQNDTLQLWYLKHEHEPIPLEISGSWAEYIRTHTPRYTLVRLPD